MLIRVFTVYQGWKYGSSDQFDSLIATLGFFGVLIFLKIATLKISTLIEFPINTPIATPVSLGVLIYHYPQLPISIPVYVVLGLMKIVKIKTDFSHKLQFWI